MHPSRLAEEALEDAALEGNEDRADATRETAMVYAMLAIADGLQNIAHGIEDLKRGFISVEVIEK